MGHKQYEPVSCDFHDQLEHFAVNQQVCTFRFRDRGLDRNNEPQERIERSAIDDVYTQNEQEFVRLRSGRVIRLDDIITVEGIRS